MKREEIRPVADSSPLASASFLRVRERRVRADEGSFKVIDAKKRSCEKARAPID